MRMERSLQGGQSMSILLAVPQARGALCVCLCVFVSWWHLLLLRVLAKSCECCHAALPLLLSATFFLVKTATGKRNMSKPLADSRVLAGIGFIPLSFRVLG